MGKIKKKNKNKNDIQGQKWKDKEYPEVGQGGRFQLLMSEVHTYTDVGQQKSYKSRLVWIDDNAQSNKSKRQRRGIFVSETAEWMTSESSQIYQLLQQT